MQYRRLVDPYQSVGGWPGGADAVKQADKVDRAGRPTAMWRCMSTQHLLLGSTHRATVSRVRGPIGSAAAC